MKSSIKLIIAMSMILGVVLVCIVFAYVFLKTDILKSEQELFGKYITQTIDHFKVVSDLQAIKEYQQLENEEKYELNTNIKIIYSEDEEEKNTFNKLNTKINIEKDAENKYLYGNAQVLYENEEYIEAEFIKEKDIYGIRFPYVTKQFVSIKNDDNIESIAENIGIDIEGLQEIIDFIDENNEISVNETVQKYKSKYLDILTQEIKKGTFSKTKNAMITFNNSEIKTNAYEVLLSSEQIKNILIEGLRNIENDIKNVKEETDLIKEYIDEIIEEIKSSKEIPELKITVYEQKQNTIRTILEVGKFKIMMDNVEEDGAIKCKISLVNLNGKQETETNIEIAKKITDTQEDFAIVISSDDDYIYSFEINYSKPDTLNKHKIVFIFGSEDKVLSIELESTINTGNDFDKIQVIGTNENMLLNNLNEQRQKQIVRFLKEQIPLKTNEKIELLKDVLILPNNKITSTDSQEIYVKLPDTTYKGMDVKEIKVNYDKKRDETLFEFKIYNTTEKDVVDENIRVNIIGKNGVVIGQITTWIQSLKVGDLYKMNVILKGNLTDTTELKITSK